MPLVITRILSLLGVIWAVQLERERETCKHFSSAKRKHLEKTNRWEWGGKIYLNILAVAGEFWLQPKGWELGEEGHAL